jgi:hypothetical protein
MSTIVGREFCGRPPRTKFGSVVSGPVAVSSQAVAAMAITAIIPKVLIVVFMVSISVDSGFGAIAVHSTGREHNMCIHIVKV